MNISRAGRFGTKGLAVTFVASETDQQVMATIQSRFTVAVPELPDHIDRASYSTFFSARSPHCCTYIARSDLLMYYCIPATTPISFFSSFESVSYMPCLDWITLLLFCVMRSLLYGYMQRV
jgi:hypothetical protein